MQFEVLRDIESVLEITGYSMSVLAEKLGVDRLAVSNWLNSKNVISENHIDDFYRFAYRNGIRLNKIKEQLYREDLKEGDVLLFHGAKTKLDGAPGLGFNKRINDFGNGFYCGESLEQSAMFVANQNKSSLYMLDFNPAGLNGKVFNVDREWMLTIAYYRYSLESYRQNDIVQRLSRTKENVDYIVAPIADNRMFEIIDQFIDGELTDVQCQHCLSATNLGMQYVMVSEKALSQLSVLERCYLVDIEKNGYLESRKESNKVNMDKVKLARRQYRNQGEYIEDILK